MILAHPDGQVFSFDAGTLCLELACTSGGEGTRRRFEVLHEPSDFARWAARSRLDLPGHGIDSAEVHTTEANLRQLKRLREAIWATAYAIATGGPPHDHDLRIINDIASGPGVVAQLDLATAATTWRRPVTARQLAAEIARDAVETLSRPARDRIRMCAGDNCYLIYLDTSRPGRRRWCSMERCGNRAKVAAHRRRRKESDSW